MFVLDNDETVPGRRHDLKLWLEGIVGNICSNEPEGYTALTDQEVDVKVTKYFAHYDKFKTN